MITHSKADGMCLVTCTAPKVSGAEVYAYCMRMVAEDPEIALIPNIWDFTGVQILGELDKLTDLHEEIGPLIQSPVKVAFVSNVTLTRAISKRYVQMFIHHKFLSYEVFSEIRQAIEWVKAKATTQL